MAGRPLSNRLVVAPMTTSQSHADGSPSEADERWLGRLADDGYGVVITCAAAVSRTSIAFQRQLSFGDDALVPALSRLATTLRRPGQLLIAQLCHGGSRAIPSLTGQPAYSASRYELSVPGFVPPLELSSNQIEGIIDDFASAAARASAAGFDGIEVHGANGYLQTQFTSTMTNTRTDAWGGSLENRGRFARECVRAIRAKVPKDFVVGYRMSFEGFGLETGLDLDENVQLMQWLVEDGISWGHLSAFEFGALTRKYPTERLLPYVRSRVARDLPLIVAGGLKSRGDVEQALELGADLCSFARAAIGNAQLPARLARGDALAWTPFARARLRDLAVSDAFASYMTDTFPVSSMNIVGA
ncbi:MAG: NADH:flavin oxidoreductase [Archangium sp.]|nr:NADH:flavin oxidoreductase [Archangium sp.]